MSIQLELYQDSKELPEIYRYVVGHVIVAVVKTSDGSLDVERVVGVNADSAEDNQVVGDFIKKIEAKLAEMFEPVPEPSKIWVPQ